MLDYRDFNVLDNNNFNEIDYNNFNVLTIKMQYVGIKISIC